MATLNDVIFSLLSWLQKMRPSDVGICVGAVPTNTRDYFLCKKKKTKTSVRTPYSYIVQSLHIYVFPSFCSSHNFNVSINLWVRRSMFQFLCLSQPIQSLINPTVKIIKWLGIQLIYCYSAQAVECINLTQGHSNYNDRLAFRRIKTLFWKLYSFIALVES